jgi:hypothetical protein
MTEEGKAEWGAYEAQSALSDVGDLSDLVLRLLP